MNCLETHKNNFTRGLRLNSFVGVPVFGLIRLGIQSPPGENALKENNQIKFAPEKNFLSAYQQNFFVVSQK